MKIISYLHQLIYESVDDMGLSWVISQKQNLRRNDLISMKKIISVYVGIRTLVYIDRDSDTNY